ncbi:unnamed protein product, partial [Ectocarpus sp. 13 AM-2016]
RRRRRKRACDGTAVVTVHQRQIYRPSSRLPVVGAGPTLLRIRLQTTGYSQPTRSEFVFVVIAIGGSGNKTWGRGGSEPFPRAPAR